jgi:Flp pilus assembly protein TadG
MVASMRNGRIWAALTGRTRGRRLSGNERGAVLIEAVIVIPLLMLITLGIIEYGSAYQQDAAVAAASRAGARVASASSKTPFGVTNTATDSGVVTANAVQAALQSVGSASPVQMEIWRVEPSDATCAPPSFTGCTYKINYQWNASSKAFTTTASATAWPPTKQFACPGTANPLGGTGPDQIGIWVQMTHKAVTHMFGGSKTLTGQTIMRLEPNPDSANCGTS